MANEQVETPRLHRLLGLLAVVSLVTASALAFGRVFSGTIPTLKLLAVGLLAVGLAAAFERRSLVLATIVSAAGLLVAVGLLVFPDSTFWGLPTRATFGAIGDAVERVGRQARVEIAPTEPLRPLLLGAVTAVWTAGFSAHALAIRSRSPFLASLPPAALVGFAGIVLEDGARYGYAALFLAALLALMFSDGLSRVRQWGPMFAWRGPSRHRLGSITSATTRGARRVAMLSVGVALLVPGILPGFRAEPLYDLNDPSIAAGVSIDPFVSVAANLQRDKPQEVFVVKADRPAYWRLLALDVFDGLSWNAHDVRASQGQLIDSEGTLLPSVAAARGEVLEQTFDITHMDSVWLPMAFEPESIELGSNAVRYDAELVTLVAPDGLTSDFSYTVSSFLATPDPSQLDVPVSYSDPQYARYLQLPPDTPDILFDIARDLTKNEPTPYRKALAIQDYIRSFEYDETVDLGQDVFTMARYLLEVRAGFCQQAASSMAALLRTLGIPSRVAVGFTPGAFNPDDELWHVSTSNAHSWVEVPFPGVGWLAFEPTPTRSNPVASAYLSPPATNPLPERPGLAGCAQSPAQCSLPRGKGGAFNQRVGFEDRASLRGAPERDPGLSLPTPPPPSRFPIGLVLWLALLTLLALAILVPLGKLSVRRARLARAREPRDRVLAAYRVFAGRAAEVGLGRAPGETLAEYASRMREGVRESPSLVRLTGIAGQAAYAPRPVTADDARGAVEAGVVAARDVRRAVPLTRRIAGVYRPIL
jgi:hypothetical protein